MTDVYRAYDAEGRLLYVGISFNAFLRLSDHARQTTWTRYAVKITLERYGTEGEARAVEAEAIRTEDPVFNRHGRPFERFLCWMAAYPDSDPGDVDLTNLPPTARTRVAMAKSFSPPE